MEFDTKDQEQQKQQQHQHKLNSSLQEPQKTFIDHKYLQWDQLQQAEP